MTPPVKALYDFAISENLLSDTAFVAAPVRWMIELDSDGNVSRLIDLREDGKNRIMEIPRQKVDNSGRTATFLVDTPKRLLGFSVESADPLEQTRAHEDFVAQIERAVSELDELRPVLQFLQDPSVIREMEAFHQMKDADRITFSLLDEMSLSCLEIRPVREYWRKVFESRQESGKSEAEVQLCLVSGVGAPIARIHPKLKKVPAGNPTGTSLITFDKEAFESHGWNQGENGPIGQDAAQAVAIGANHLLSSSEHKMSLGGKKSDSVLLWWLKPEHGERNLVTQVTTHVIRSLDLSAFPDELDELEAESTADSHSIRAAVVSVFSGKRPLLEISEGSRFFAMVLSGNGGRAGIRRWFDEGIGSVLESVRRWYEDTRIHDPDVEERATPVPLWKYTVALQLNEDARTLVHLELIEAALRRPDHPIPLALHLKALLRQRIEIAEVGSSWIPGDFKNRARFLRLCYNRFASVQGESTMPERLSEDRDEPAYILGRVMCLVESIQRSSGDGRNLNVTTTDRYYASLSQRPLTVFPAMIQLTKKHLARLRRLESKAALAKHLEDRLALMMSRLEIVEFPSRLSNQEQTAFHLGYFHQKAHDIEEMRERKHSDHGSGAEGE